MTHLIRMVRCFLTGHDWHAPVRPLYYDIRWCKRCRRFEQLHETSDGVGSVWIRGD